MPYYIDANKVKLEELMLRITESDLVPSRRKLLENIEINFDKLRKQGIITLADLRKAIKSPKNMVHLAEFTKIESEYLNLLRREVESYFPKACKISAFDWLDREQLSKLERIGYKNTAVLYEAFEIPCKREGIVASNGLEDSFVDEVFALVDLTRIQWVSPIFSKVLLDAGYKSVESIAEAKVAELYEAVEKTNAGNRYFKGNIGIRDIARLIKSASEVVIDDKRRNETVQPEGGTGLCHTVNIRAATVEDRDFLRDMFYEAIFVPEGEEKPDYAIVDEPVLQKYTYNWMLPTDMGLVAEMDGTPVGMLWTRLFSAEAPGYGYVDDHTPEMSMAIRPEWQGQGIGKALMEHALKALGEQGYARVSLSVSKANEKAFGLYRSMGFSIVLENHEDFLMLREL